MNLHICFFLFKKIIIRRYYYTLPIIHILLNVMKRLCSHLFVHDLLTIIISPQETLLQGFLTNLEKFASHSMVLERNVLLILHVQWCLYYIKMYYYDFTIVYCTTTNDNTLYWIPNSILLLFFIFFRSHQAFLI